MSMMNHAYHSHRSLDKNGLQNQKAFFFFSFSANGRWQNGIIYPVQNAWDLSYVESSMVLTILFVVPNFWETSNQTNKQASKQAAKRGEHEARRMDYVTANTMISHPRFWTERPPRIELWASYFFRDSSQVRVSVKSDTSSFRTPWTWLGWHLNVVGLWTCWVF